MASENWPTFVLLALYVLAMIIVTIVANRQNAAAHAAAANENHIKNHFLASKQFGVVVLFLTTFASLFSGYTVAGVPNEAGALGFSAIRWIGSNGMIAVSFLSLFPRLRRISVAREYISPGDFVFDRFRSKVLSVLNTLLLCIPQLLYVTVQFHALGATLDNFTNGELPFNAVVIVSAFLMLIFESLGGLRTVAYTDVVQAIVMVLIFMILPIILAVMYGGFGGMVVNTDNLPCLNDNSFEQDVNVTINNITYTNGTEIVESGCLNYQTGPYDVDEYYLRSPSGITIANYLLFGVSLMSFGLNPHVMQRVMAAENDGQIRIVLIALALTPFVCQLPGVLTGISYLSNVDSLEPPLNKYRAFESTLGLFQSKGGFRGFIAYVALLGAVAGIMSTADSALIGVSNTFVVDIFKNWLTPNLAPTKIVWIGKVVSFTVVTLAVLISINMQATSIKTGEPVSYGALLAFQQALLWQAFPSYIGGMYSNISWKSMLTGICFGLFSQVIFFIIAGATEEGAMKGVDGSWSVLSAVACNVLAMTIAHLIFGGDEEGNEAERVDVNHESDETYFDLRALTVGKIRKIMGGIEEPMIKYKGLFVYLCAFFALICVVFWVGEVDPALIEQFGERETSLLLYNGHVRSVIGGFPSWAFISMLCYGGSTVCAIVAALLWTTDKVQSKETEMVAPTSPTSTVMSAESPKSESAGSVEMNTTVKEEEDKEDITTDV